MIESLADRTAALQAQAVARALPTSRPAPMPIIGPDDVFIADDVVPDPVAYRQRVLALPFQSVTIGSVTFHGIAACTDLTVPDWIRTRFPQAQPGVTFFRQSPEGQVEPNFIHTDRDMGDWTAILYLNPEPPADDGTAFWQSRDTGANASTALTEAESHAEWLAWRERERWEVWATVPAKFNRMVLFPAPLFHSRAIDANYGAGADARLIQIVFGTGELR